jgi:Na+/H+ antiporter NhaD/arsenite permease-like protein
VSITLSAALAAGIFLLVFLLIALDRVDKTKAALAGAAAVLLLGLVGQQVALGGGESGGGVDWNTIFLLLGMMIIVVIAGRTGVFGWLAVRAAQAVHGSPLGVLVLLALVTAVLSALLDNVTTVLAIAPVVLLLCERMRLDPIPFLIGVILAANFGGAATLIGHPPNIMIGSATGFTFLDFLRVDAPIAALCLLLYLIAVCVFMRRRWCVSPEDRRRIMAVDANESLTDRPLLRRCLVVFSLTLLGFLLQGQLGLPPATIALAGAAALLLLDREDVEDVLREVEWPTLLFFIGLFIMVGALVNTGVISSLGRAVTAAAGGSVPHLTLGLLWFSGAACGIIDQIPYAAAVIPMVQQINAGVTAGGAPASGEPLWWALSLGCGLGANLTLIASATNVVVADMAARAGYRINFWRFLKYGAPVTIGSLLLSSLYLWARFLR